MTDIQTVLASATQVLSNCSDTPLLDAQVLLCHSLSKPHSHLRAWPEKQLTRAEHSHFQRLFEQRKQGFPIAYIIGCREFWSRDFKVNPSVLIPRPDTELLVEISLRLMVNKTKPRLIELGTGAGIIAITLAAERPDLAIIATDKSQEALELAQENAQFHNTNSIQFMRSNWFAEVAQSTFDLVVSNPPYIAPNDPHLLLGDLRFEPTTALVSAKQGLQDIGIICQQARTYLRTGASLLIEHGFDQQTPVKSLFSAAGYTNINVFTDLAGHPRVTTGQWLH